MFRPTFHLPRNDERPKFPMVMRKGSNCSRFNAAQFACFHFSPRDCRLRSAS
jgi:hypothetical protein